MQRRGNLPSARRGTEEPSKHSSGEPGRSARRLQQVPVRAPTALMDTHRRFVRYLLRDWLPRLHRVTSCSLELERTNVEPAVYFIIGVFEVHCTNCRPIRRSSPPPCTHDTQPLVGRIPTFIHSDESLRRVIIVVENKGLRNARVAAADAADDAAHSDSLLLTACGAVIICRKRQQRRSKHTVIQIRRMEFTCQLPTSSVIAMSIHATH